ncbi:MAG: CoA transferase [Pseudomonadota bacterium]
MDDNDSPATWPTVNAGSGFDLLAGVKVLDLTTSIAGPYAALQLGDFGADVVKVERPGVGDDARHWGPPFLDGEALWFLAVNRNKRSVALDHTAAEGRAVLEALIKASDVVVVNSPAPVQRKLRVDYETVRALRDDIIFVSITGFGLSGARADWPCYDLIAEGYSGVMDLTGEPENGPQKVGAPAADVLAGADAAMAAMAALFDRQRTGRGHLIDVSLVESMTRFLSCRIVAHMGSGAVPRRSGGRDSVIAIYQAFETADHPITLGLGNDRIWRRFWAAMGMPERGEVAAHATNAGRHEYRAEIVAEIGALLCEYGRAHWLELFTRSRVPAGPINRVDEVARDPALIARSLMFCAADEAGRVVPQVGTGILVDGAANGVRQLPPRLGADTAAVLCEVGFDAAAVAALAADGVVGGTD